MSAHDCESCTECLHDGHRCCGCYDGTCCKKADLLARDPDTLTLSELADLAFGPMKPKETR